MKLFEIKSWHSGAILFSLECGSLKLCVQAAVSGGANLRGANLRDADLRDANLRDADLRDANLRDADLRDANLSDADLRDADLRDADLRDADLRDADLRDADLRDANFDVAPATPEQATANLDKVREIILDNQELLNMGHWHQTSDWKERTCAEEAVCGTTHCLAGWLQICSTDPEIRKLEAQIAGTLCAPVAAKMFFAGDDEVFEWLQKREYAQAAA